ncbi:kinase-like domain [Fusarium albosuccineum]|uniref:Kinase-like domain n=1 Tax=Fusarium albosuccineum TaxID=1237068 RepID=A0A8H4LPC2_9HYPO|nr:kinase-like domain [Fusarium albosuccineum]
MEEINPPNDISITQIDTGDGDGAGIVLDYNGLQVSVSIFSPPSTQQNKQPEISTDILESRIIRLLEQANCAEEIDDDYENILDEVLSVILTAWKHGSNTPTPLPTDTAGNGDLSPHGAAVLTTIEPHKAYSPLAVDEQGSGPAFDDIETVDSLPRYTPKAVSIRETFVQGGSHIVSRVQIDNHSSWLCKACAGARKFLDSNVERELEMSHDIRKACLSSQDALARVPQLRGYIEGPNTGFVIGFLRLDSRETTK